jgi:hypothetical protein
VLQIGLEESVHLRTELFVSVAGLVEVFATLVGSEFTRVAEVLLDTRVLFRVDFGATRPAGCPCYAKSLYERGASLCPLTTSTRS